jgi:hypothetical protein
MAGRKGRKVGKEGGEDVGDEGLWGSACFLLTCLAAAVLQVATWPLGVR